MSIAVVDRAPVTLDDLNRAAALLTRVDRKYVLAASAADAVLAALPHATRVLEIDGARTFAYRSTYFDTPDLACYLGTAHRRRRRYKVRTRTYVDSGECFLEVKTRRGDATVKRRLPWSGPADRIDADGLGFVDGALAEDRIQLDGALTPTLDVDYLRTTLLMPDGASRATVDSALTWRDRATGRTRTAPGVVIVETKSGAGPSSADHVLWRRGHRPVAVSKYATGLAALRPGLPHNRWHRLLSRADLAA